MSTSSWSSNSPRKRAAFDSRRGAIRASIHAVIEAMEARRLLHGALDVFDQPCALSRPPELPIAGKADSATTPTRHPLSSLPSLSSRPGAAATLFLDFNGDITSNWAGYQPRTTPALDQDADPATFTDAELATIRDTWAAVAEDFSPFNLNVTTIDPGNRDNARTQCIVIGGDGAWYAPAGGVSFVGSFTSPDPNTGFVFINNNANFIAAAVSHEAGHGFGLQHQSSYDAFGAKIDEYSHGDSLDAPIMGYGYAARQVWWTGPSSISADDVQNDMEIIASADNGFGYRADDHPDSPTAGSLLAGAASDLVASGVIEHATDSDWFSFTTTAGSVSLRVDVTVMFADLDARLELRSAGGSLISAADTSSLGEAFTLNLSAGTYRLGVASHHYPDPGPSGFTTRVGDTGQYTIHITRPPAQAPFFGVPHAVAASGNTTIQCEDFDAGGEGLAYHDTTSPNLGRRYRLTEGVDIKTSGDTGGGYRLSDVVAGEWVEYTINVIQSGTYSFAFRVAAPDPGARFHGEIDGANFTGSLAVADTNSYSVFKSITKSGVALPAGIHVLRLAFDANASPANFVGAFDWIRITREPIGVSASAATHVRDGASAGVNFGAASLLQVKNSPYKGFNREAYLRFDLGGAPEDFAAAKLRLLGATESSAARNLSIGIYALNDPLAGWGESGLNWTNKPSSKSTAIATRTITDSIMRQYEIDLTSFLKSQKAAGRTSVTLVIKMSSPQSRFVQFASNEASSGAPQLVFTP